MTDVNFSKNQIIDNTIYSVELGRHLLLNGNIDEWVDIFKLSLQAWNTQLILGLLQIAKQTSSDTLTRCIVKRWEGKYWLQFGEWDKAIRALEIAINNLPTESHRQTLYPSLLNELGLVYRQKGDYERAKELYKQGLEVSIDLMAQEIIVQFWSNLGVIARLQGRIDEAIDYYNQSLHYYEEIGDARKQVSTLNNLGIVYKNLANWEKATAYYQRAVELAKSLDDKHVLGILRVNLGNCLYPQGKWYDAFDEYQRALDIFLEFKDQAAASKALSGLGIICNYREEWEQAENYLRQSVEHARQLQDNLGCADALNNLGIALVNQARMDEAEQCCMQSLALYASMRHLQGRANVLNNLGRLYERKEEYKESIDYYREAIEITKKLGSTWDELDTHINLARTMIKSGEISSGSITLDYVIAESQRLKFLDHMTWALKGKGDLLLLLEKSDESLKNYKQAWNIAKTINPYMPQKVISSIKNTLAPMIQIPDELSTWLSEVYQGVHNARA